LVVIDDGSSDESAAWLAEFCGAHDRVRVHTTSGLGLAAALNAGLAQTDSEYVARMDADDIWIRGRLERQISAMQGDSRIAAVGCQIIRFVGGKELSTTHLPRDHDAIVHALQRGHHAICHASVMMRRSNTEQIGGYWEEGVAEDSDLFLRLSLTGTLANLPFAGLKVRIHGSGINAKRQFDVQKFMAYSAATYRRPRGAVTIQQYDQQLNALQRLDLRRKALGLSLYRRGLIALHEERVRLSPRLQLAASAALMPERSLQRVTRRLVPKAEAGELSRRARTEAFLSDLDADIA